MLRNQHYVFLATSQSNLWERQPQNSDKDVWRCASCKYANYACRKTCNRCGFKPAIVQTHASAPPVRFKSPLNTTSQEQGVAYSPAKVRNESSGTRESFQKAPGRRRCVVCYKAFRGDESKCKQCEFITGSAGKCVFATVLLGDWLCSSCNVYNYRHSDICPTCGGQKIDRARSATTNFKTY